MAPSSFAESTTNAVFFEGAMPVKVAVIYYSSTGTTHQLARAVEEGARECGADVRFRKVQELASEEPILSNTVRPEHDDSTRQVPQASLDDLEWADAIVFGTPSRYGLPTAELKQFLDTTGPLRGAGKLVNKIVSSFTTAATRHGGQETTITSLNTTFYHWGAIIVSPGYADPVQDDAGNPYGAPFTSHDGERDADRTALDSARCQGRRVAEVASQFVVGRQHATASLT